MKRWISILLLLFGVAAVHAQADCSPEKPVSAVSAVLSQAEDLPIQVEAPLFATAFSAGSSRLAGSEPAPVRVRSYCSTYITWNHHAPVRFVGSPAAPIRDAVVVLAGAARPADRYVYALRRIII